MTDNVPEIVLHYVRMFPNIQHAGNFYFNFWRKYLFTFLDPIIFAFNQFAFGEEYEF
jgi:hypothetical protein